MSVSWFHVRQAVRREYRETTAFLSGVALGPIRKTPQVVNLRRSVYILTYDPDLGGNVDRPEVRSPRLASHTGTQLEPRK